MISSFTTKGVRENNEDSVVTMTVEDGIAYVHMVHNDQCDDYETLSTMDDGTTLIAIADGMGGLNAGEKASFITLSTLVDLINQIIEEKTDMSNIINNLVSSLSNNVRNNIPGDVGSTLVAVLKMGRTYWIFSTGDSRCYVKTSFGVWTSKTHNYSANGEKTNIITDYIGMDGAPGVYTEVFSDITSIIIGSDGLEPAVDAMNEEIFDVESAKDLCEKAIALGSKDNTSAIIYVP